MKKSKFWHTPKSNIIRLVVMLPIFIFTGYKGIAEDNYYLAIGSIALCFFVVLFATNYWFQAIVCLIGSLIALYYDTVWLTLILWLLFLYAIHATNFAKREDLDLSSANKIEDNENRTRAIIIDLMMHRSPRTSIRIGSTVILILLSFLFVIPYLILKIWTFIQNTLSMH